MQERGSKALIARLFGGNGPVSTEGLSTAVAEAKAADFKIVSWWWRGQPSIERIVATLDVDPASLGETVSGLAQIQGAGRSVAAEVFPYGIPKLDRVHVRVRVDVNPG